MHVVSAKPRAGPMRFMLKPSCWVQPRNEVYPRPHSCSSADALRAGGRTELPRRHEKGLFVLPPGGETQTFPGANLGLRVAFLPNLCLTAPSAPSSHGALPSPCQRPEAHSHFLCPHPDAAPRNPEELRGKRGRNSGLAGVQVLCSVRLCSLRSHLRPAASFHGPKWPVHCTTSKTVTWI